VGSNPNLGFRRKESRETWHRTAEKEKAVFGFTLWSRAGVVTNDCVAW